MERGVQGANVLLLLLLLLLLLFLLLLLPRWAAMHTCG
jgi:hypothetical protein